MPQLKKNDIDLLKSPPELAERRYREQLEQVVEQLQPRRPHPVTEFLHSRGITLKELANLGRTTEVR